LDPNVILEGDDLIKTIAYMCCSLAQTGMLLYTVHHIGNHHLIMPHPQALKGEPYETQTS
jgi:hypothetical protein